MDLLDFQPVKKFSKNFILTKIKIICQLILNTTYVRIM